MAISEAEPAVREAPQRPPDDVWDRLGRAGERFAPDALHQRLLFLLILGSLLLRMLWLGLPDGALIFDEKYYVNAARVIAGLPPRQDTYQDKPLGLDPNIEHPPLAKVITAGTIRLLGDNPYGWRLPSVLFGTLAVYLMYRIGRRLSGDPYLGLLAATLLCFDNLFFVHGRIFTLDISMLALLLLGLDLYLGGRIVLAGLALALAALCKLPGGFGLLVLGAYELLLLYPSPRGPWSALVQASRPALWRLARLGLAFLVAFLLLLGILDRLWTEFPQPLAHLQHISTYAQLLRRQAPSGVESVPWQWLLNDVEIPYIKVEQQVRVGDELKENRPVVFFRGAMNPYVLDLWPLVLPFAACVWWARRPGANLAALSLAWFAMMLLPFVAASLIGQRISYLFYFLPTLPSIVLATSGFLLTPGLPRPVLWVYLGAVLLGFYGYFPFRPVP
jgi:predicted membrane-bound dolichyl-phosphate-mannose-protein mannosyltransferase